MQHDILSVPEMRELLSSKVGARRMIFTLFLKGTAGDALEAVALNARAPSVISMFGLGGGGSPLFRTFKFGKYSRVGGLWLAVLINL